MNPKAVRVALGELAYLLTCLGFSIVIGAGLHEHVLVWPKWSAAPPVSFTMFAGEYGIEPQAFWSRLHPALALTSLTALALCWRTTRRRFLLPALLLYAAVMIATALYFAPEALAIIDIGVGPTVDEELLTRTRRWERLSLVRILLLAAVTLWLYHGLRQPRAAEA